MSCRQPMVWKAFDDMLSWHSSNNLCVRFRTGHFRQNTKSTCGRKGLSSYSTRTTENRRMGVQSCHVRKACSWHACSHNDVGIGYTATCCCIVTQSANHTDFLIFKLYVYYFLENALMRRLLSKVGNTHTAWRLDIYAHTKNLLW